MTLNKSLPRSAVNCRSKSRCPRHIGRRIHAIVSARGYDLGGGMNSVVELDGLQPFCSDCGAVEDLQADQSTKRVVGNGKARGQAGAPRRCGCGLRSLQPSPGFGPPGSTRGTALPPGQGKRRPPRQSLSYTPPVKMERLSYERRSQICVTPSTASFKSLPRRARTSS